MVRYSALHQAIGLLWPELPAHFGERWPDVDVALTTLLRLLDGDAAREAEDEIYELFASAPAALDALNRAVAQLTQTQQRSRALREGLVSRLERHVVVPVFYGTDRSVERTDDVLTYTGERGTQLRFGRASVTIPDDHRMGAVERPRWWRLEFREDPARHVTIAGLVELDGEQFVEAARDAGARAGAPEALIFVHGYNVSFDDALRRAAQIAYDLHFAGVPMLFSWPSSGTLQGYLMDETNVRWAQNHFREFLRLCVASLGLATVHVVAHSMGNRVLAETLGAGVEGIADGKSARLDQIVFAAPDIDTDTFRQLAAEFRGRAGRYTLYASSKDLALERSRRFHGYPRAGYCVDGVFVAEGVDAIDASAVDTSLIGHSYYGDNRSLLSDLFQLFNARQGPDHRFGLLARDGPHGRYWEFRP